MSKINRNEIESNQELFQSQMVIGYNKPKTNQKVLENLFQSQKIESYKLQ